MRFFLTILTFLSVVPAHAATVDINFSLLFTATKVYDECEGSTFPNVECGAPYPELELFEPVTSVIAVSGAFETDDFRSFRPSDRATTVCFIGTTSCPAFRQSFPTGDRFSFADDVLTIETGSPGNIQSSWSFDLATGEGSHTYVNDFSIFFNVTRFEFTDVQALGLSEIPLPASAWMLLGSFAFLDGFRRMARRKKSFV